MKIIIHGGFFSESSTNHETKVAKQQALLRIVKDSYDYLKTHTAFETVVYAVSLLEDDELFNAGIGSQIQSDGKIRMSASLMDGSTMKMSGVINIEEVKNPMDHRNLNLDFVEFQDLNPTAENIALVIWNKIRNRLDIKYNLEIRLWETDRNSVFYNGQ